MEFSKQVKNFAKEEIIIRKITVETRAGELEQLKLKFYSDNPRIYSVLGVEQREPDQEDIEKYLKGMPHVKDLAEDIKENGGLIDPILVRDKTFEVLEGNSRLAAYRILSEPVNEQLKWKKIKCKVLPADIDEKLIFALLGQYHIKGKKDWDRYEQAGFIYRRNKKQGIDIEVVGKEIGLTKGKAQKLIDIYQFMIDKNEADIKKWSYYEVYFTSRPISDRRKDHPVLDDVVVAEIQSGSIEKAQDLREKLPAICNNEKIFKKYLNKKLDLYNAYDLVDGEGGTSDVIKKLDAFNKWIYQKNKDDLAELPIKAQNKLKYLLTKINTKTETLLKQIFPK